MNRRTWFRSLAIAIGTLPLGGLALAQEPRGVATLSEQLRFGLKCRRPLEFDFVALVVQKVDQKELPRDMVLSAFDYARKKNSERPFPYFQFSMRKRAAAIGVEL